MMFNIFIFIYSHEQLRAAISSPLKYVKVKLEYWKMKIQDKCHFIFSSETNHRTSPRNKNTKPLFLEKYSSHDESSW